MSTPYRNPLLNAGALIQRPDHAPLIREGDPGGFAYCQNCRRLVTVDEWTRGGNCEGKRA